MNGGDPVAAAPGSASTAARLAALASAGDGHIACEHPVASPRSACASRPAAAPDRGIFETVIGSLLGFFL